MTSKRIQLGCTVALATLGLIAASDGAAKWHPRGKARPAAKRMMANVSVSHGNTTIKPNTDVALSVGHGQLINLGQPISDIFTSNPGSVDVHVRTNTQIYLFGKGRGDASVYATNKAGQIIFSANVVVDQNIDSIDQMLQAAIPDAQIRATRVNGHMIVLTGLVLNPEDAVQATMLVNGYVGNDPKIPGGKTDVMVINRIKTATPQQVNLQVRIAEVSHSVSKNIGANLTQAAKDGSTVFGISSGRNVGTIGTQNLAALPTRDFSTQFGYPAGTLAPLPYNPANPGIPVTSPGATYNLTNLAQGAGSAALGIGGHFLGMDILGALDLAESVGDASTLAQPNLTALSGETASFLAGGEIPIPIATATGGGSSISIDYKSYGVSLSFTPIVLADGRISMRVRPEVSELDYSHAVTISGFSTPGLKTRRSETTVELGSGQSMVISGLLQNNSSSTKSGPPGLGDVPILGAMFRSSAYQRGETELMIVVTPYLVKPVNANQIVLPTDGYKAPTDLERVLLGKNRGGTTGGDRPKPHMAPPATKVGPAIGALEALPATPQPAPARDQIGQVQALPAPAPTSQPPKPKSVSGTDAAPGFGS